MEKFILLSLAVWRLSSLFAREDGPFDILIKVRLFLGVKFDEENEEFGSNWISKGILCCWCNSIWFAALLAPTISTGVIDWFINLLALSAITIFIESRIV